MPSFTLRAGTLDDLAWIAPLLERSPEAAQWLPGDDPLRVVDGVAILVYRQVAEGEFEILNLAVAPEARRRGLARALVADALSLGGRWFLEVRESNAAARALYGSLGFREIGERRAYYNDPPEKAIVLVREA
ncbi:MAG: GNAT family N-acetyltransferase [Bryobacteraceae bacterium]|nr:GNAT family N-acetyltransferase [Bryobacteraceae bacterium]